MSGSERDVVERLPLVDWPSWATRRVRERGAWETPDLSRLAEWAWPQMRLAGVTSLDGDVVAVLAEWNSTVLSDRQRSGDGPVLVRRILGEAKTARPISPAQRLVFVALGNQRSALRVLGRLAPLGEAVWVSDETASLGTVEAAEFDWRGVRVVRPCRDGFMDVVRPAPAPQRISRDRGPGTVQVALRHEQIYELAVRYGAVTDPAALPGLPITCR